MPQKGYTAYGAVTMRKNIITSAKAIFLIQKKTALKAYIPALFILMCLLQSTRSGAQYIEFVENKGQWDSSMLFKGTYSAGAIVLKPDGGYRVMLNNRDDLKRIEETIHGELQTSTTTTAPVGKKPATSATAATAPTSTTGSTGIILHSYVYEVSFVNANPHPIAIPEKAQPKYNNYFIGNDPTKWAGKCAVYNAVTFKDVYPGIDVHYYTTDGHLKYDIIVNQGGDVSKVALSITGAEGLHITGGDLIVKTSVDDVKELAPYSYSASAEGNKQLQCKYNLNRNIITFKFADKIQPGTPLVIDPTLIFCSFSGSTADNWGYTATYDAAGNFYAGGIIFGTGFPYTNGAYETAFQGGNNNTGEGSQDPNTGQSIDENGFDISVMKFNSTGTTVLYATYLGGSTGNEQPQSLVADGDGNLIIAGRTTSTTGSTGDYPTLAPNIIGTGGGQDIVLTKLSADGSSLLGSLRIGGTSDDGVNIHTKDLGTPGTLSIRRNYGDDARGEVILDNAGNICLASCTQSTDFPLVNAFDNTLGGTQDAVLLKFAPGLSSQPILSTFLGGSGDDAAFVLAQDPITGNFYVAGATTSSNLPGISGTGGTPLSGSFIGGACDGFISEISGNSLVKTVYFGTTAADQIYGIDFNKAGNPFIMGTTEGAITPINSPYNANGNQAQGKQFIAKLQPDLSGVVYSSNFGPAGRKYPNISPTAFLVDICENVYVSGWGAGLDSLEPYSNSGLYGLPTTVTTNTNQLSYLLKGLGNFYFFVMAKDANSQLYGAFLGNTNDYDGVHVDGGTSRFDKSGVIYQAICACGPDNSLASSNAVAHPTPGAAYNRSTYGCNLTSIKIAFNFAGVRAAVKSSITGSTNDTTGCVPLAINFTDTIGNAQKYIWNFGDGTGNVTTTSTTTSHTFTKIGTYKVMLVAVDSTTCNITDTSYTDIRVKDNPATLTNSYKKLLPCDAFTYEFYSNSNPASASDSAFTWNFGDGTTTTTGIDSIQHAYAAAGTYTVSVTLNDTVFCNAPLTDSFKLSVASLVKAVFTTPSSGCAPYTAQFTNTSSAGQQFYWNFGDGSTSTQTNPTHYYSKPGIYPVELVAVDSSTCNIADSTTINITVYSLPNASFNFSPQPAVENTPVTLTNTSTSATNYKWDFGDGSTLVTTQDTVVTHQYVKTGTYNVCLIAYNADGCADTACQAVAAIVVPLADVPNALTANGDGLNDHIYVRGFGITKMDWKIYNRWGNMVFESTDPTIGWDGRYKGTMQAQDVYVYVLNVDFGDGTKYQKKGDITLLR